MFENEFRGLYSCNQSIELKKLLMNFVIGLFPIYLKLEKHLKLF